MFPELVLSYVDRRPPKGPRRVLQGSSGTGSYDVVLADRLDLGERLAPHGVLVLSVQGSFGSSARERWRRACQRVPGEQRGRLAQRLRSPVWGLEAPPGETSEEASFTVAELMEKARAAGLVFLRWREPRDWRLDSVLKPMELPELKPEQVWALIERVGHRPRLEAIFGAPGSAPRPFGLGPLLALSPECLVSRVSRRAAGGVIHFGYGATVRQGPTLPLDPLSGYLVELASPGPVALEELLERASALGSREALEGRLEGLLAEEVLYRPWD